MGGCTRSPRGRTIAGLRDAAAGSSVVVCVLDAARVDHLGCCGYPRETTPNIDRLASESLVFEQHFTQASFTKPSTASLFTSQYPDTHLVLTNVRNRGIADSSFTMARGLGAAGFQTGFFSSNPWVDVKKGMGRNFHDAYGLDEAGEVQEEGGERFAPEPLLELFRGWLPEHVDERFFVYLHFMPPHTPYRQPEEYTSLFRGTTPPGYLAEKYRPGQYDVPIGDESRKHPPLPRWINLYDANLRYGDWVVGEVESMLREAGVLENTLLVVTSDHGEAFGEHGYVLHGGPVHDEVSHIPFLLRFPGGGQTGRISALTQTVDVLPTVFELLDIKVADEVQGRSLLPVMTGGAEEVNEFVFTRAKPDPSCPDDRAKYMVRSRSHALLLYSNGRWRALYDLNADPEQRHNVIDSQPAVTREMVEVFREFAMQQGTPPLSFVGIESEAPVVEDLPRPERTPQLEREPRALGYLQ